VGHPSDPGLRVLHALRLKWVADESGIAAATGLDDSVVRAELDAAHHDGLAEQRAGGRVPGWRLTDEGKVVHRKRLEEELETSGQRPAIHDAYQGFLAQNGELLALCTAWQMRSGNDGQPALNDHADRGYDDAVLVRLDRVHERIAPVLADLSAALDRFTPYATRLATAHAQVHRGGIDWLTRPLMDSYHTIWFELHEDLLVTLGIERKEGEH
jgi:hypothetical protein